MRQEGLEGVRRGKNVYLAFILDCYSRMIVGWQLATHLRTDLVLDALEMANGLRRPRKGLIAHSHRGSQWPPPKTASTKPRALQCQPRSVGRRRSFPLASHV
jgi:transposase InsO family protein